MDLGFVLITGLITSLHCVSMCGTMVATYAIRDSSTSEKTFDAAPHLAYHTLRLVSYLLVGLVLGTIGHALNLSGVRGAASLLAGAFMILMGLGMLNVHPVFRIFSLRMPKRLQQMMFKDRGEEANRLVTPAVFGIMTGLMPCGPLQAMELYAAGTGSALRGAAVMLLFGITTVPMMLAFGAATQALGHTFRKRVMTVGAVVIMILGAVMLNRGLMLTGSPVTFGTVQTTVARALGLGSGSGGAAATQNGNIQQATIVIENTTYVPDTVALKAGVPVRLTIDRRESVACSDQLVIPSLGVRAALKPNGKTVIGFTPRAAGQIPFTCGMGMMSGRFIVSDAR